MMAVSESMQWMVHMQSPDSDHHEKLAMDDMPKVLKIIDTVMECMRNPFVPTVAAEKLVNIAKGEIFTSSDVVDSKQLGLDVIAHARSTDAEKIISPKILTFAGQQKQTKKRQDSVKQIVSEEGTVARALCFTRELTEEDIISCGIHIASVLGFGVKVEIIQGSLKELSGDVMCWNDYVINRILNYFHVGNKIYETSIHSIGFGVKVEIIQSSLKELSGDDMCWNDYVSIM
ncbi:hypothetical protein GQR58_003951 [Nymphon striatum]|nr:hypothetical protein GQR58_003951 [Nymphon striatum]